MKRAKFLNRLMVSCTFAFVLSMSGFAPVAWSATSMSGAQPNPSDFNWSIGFEGPSINTSPFAKPAIYLSKWLNEDSGIETYFGYSKSEGDPKETTSVAENITARTKTTTLTYSGTDQGKYFVIGGGYKVRLYQSEIFQVSISLMAAFTPSVSTSYKTGTRTETIADTNSPTTYAVQETALGTVDTKTDSYLRYGPRISVQTYLPFLKHVSVGFATGVFMSSGGKTTKTTNTATRTFNVNAGTDQTPTASSTSTSTEVTTPGSSSDTYSIGGTGLALGTTNFNPITVTGTFVLRYEF